MKYSDLIVPRGVENAIAIDFIAENLRNRLKMSPVKQKVAEEEDKKNLAPVSVIVRNNSEINAILDKIDRKDENVGQGALG